MMLPEALVAPACQTLVPMGLERLMAVQPAGSVPDSKPSAKLWARACPAQSATAAAPTGIACRGRMVGPPRVPSRYPNRDELQPHYGHPAANFWRKQVKS